MTFTRPLQRYWYFSFVVAANKKTPVLRGFATSLIPLISRNTMILRRNWHPSCYVARGLPGFTGPFPSTSLDESSYCYCKLFGCSCSDFSVVFSLVYLTERTNVKPPGASLLCAKCLQLSCIGRRFIQMAIDKFLERRIVWSDRKKSAIFSCHSTQFVDIDPQHLSGRETRMSLFRHHELDAIACRLVCYLM